MAELELIRSRADRRLYEIGGVGTLRFRGLFSRRATAESGAGTWSFDRRAKSWGKRPVRLTVAEPGLVEPGLLLFAAFIVRQLAEDAGASAAASTAANTG